jgi:maleylpyruvate isomerase
VKLYSYWRSTSAWRARIVLDYKGLAYDYVPVDLSPDVTEQESEEYASVNAYRQVPTLEWVEGESVVRLAQSVAIAEYLEERYPHPRLLPEGALARARVRRAVEIVNSGIQPHQNSRTLAALRQLTGEKEIAEWCLSAIARGLGALEMSARAHGGRFSVGNEPTLADVFLVPQLYNARRFGVDPAPFPNLFEIEARAAELPAFARAHPDRQPDAPAIAPSASARVGAPS